MRQYETIPKQNKFLPLMPVVLPVVALVALVVEEDSSVRSMYNGIKGSIMPTVALAMVAAIAT